jgi:uncharacterized membrane protein
MSARRSRRPQSDRRPAASGTGAAPRGSTPASEAPHTGGGAASVLALSRQAGTSDPVDTTPDSDANTAAGSRGRWLSNERTRLAATMAALCAIAIVALGYLAIVKLTNSTAVCFVVQGCDQVQASSYSTFLGIPVAIYGLAVTVVIMAAVLAWWRTGDARLLYVPYGLGLISVFVIAGLVYLELFVIHAICIWCTTAGAGLILGWLVSIVAVRRFGLSG